MQDFFCANPQGSNFDVQVFEGQPKNQFMGAPQNKYSLINSCQQDSFLFSIGNHKMQMYVQHTTKYTLFDVLPL